MENEQKTQKKTRFRDEQTSHVLYFIKDCDCGTIINERLLPDSVEDSNLARLFIKCIDCFIYANTLMESVKFHKLVTSSVGDYSKLTIENRSQLRELLDKLCNVCKICPNFISEERIENCSLCDNEENQPQTENVIFILPFFYLKNIVYIFDFVVIPLVGAGDTNFGCISTSENTRYSARSRDEQKKSTDFSAENEYFGCRGVYWIKTAA